MDASLSPVLTRTDSCGGGARRYSCPYAFNSFSSSQYPAASNETTPTPPANHSERRTHF